MTIPGRHRYAFADRTAAGYGERLPRISWAAGPIEQFSTLPNRSSPATIATFFVRDIRLARRRGGAASQGVTRRLW